MWAPSLTALMRFLCFCSLDQQITCLLGHSDRWLLLQGLHCYSSYLDLAAAGRHWFWLFIFGFAVFYCLSLSLFLWSFLHVLKPWCASLMELLLNDRHGRGQTVNLSFSWVFLLGYAWNCQMLQSRLKHANRDISLSKPQFCIIIDVILIILI